MERDSLMFEIYWSRNQPCSSFNNIHVESKQSGDTDDYRSDLLLHAHWVYSDTAVLGCRYCNEFLHHMDHLQSDNYVKHGSWNDRLDERRHL